MRVIDSRVISENIVSGEVVDGKLDSLFQSDSLVAIDTPASWINFPTAFADTPIVTTAPGPSVTYARVTTILPGSFEWQSDAAGSASWMAWGHKT